MRTILKPEWILDGSGRDPLRGHAVVVEEELIVSVEPATEQNPSTADRVVELPGMTLTPGLCNNHVHLVLPGDSAVVDQTDEHLSDAQLTIRAVHNLVTALRAGVTTMRDCGGRGRIVVDVRNAQAAGLIEGSRVISCAWPLTITGGHTRQFGGEADGEIALRRMVRTVASHGVDFVKVMASGGGTPGTYPQYPSFTVDELRVIVETAHGLGLQVSAHCTNAAATINAIEAGIDMIEHAMFFTATLIPQLDRRVIERLAEAQIPVTPTLQVDRDMA
ncbi:MAG: amidohydrolase family protein, partial [Anaerolineales bacterium]|nr:amidohydrolase family protein [Anaerolineales bacterium]